MTAGRPCEFTQGIADSICERLSHGLSLREICRDEVTPDYSTVKRWLIKFPEFSAQYARAREAQADHFAEEILEIADDASNDWIERQRKDGSTEIALDREHVQRSALRIDSRKWLMARMAPKKYSERLLNEHVGKDGGPVIMQWLPPSS